MEADARLELFFSQSLDGFFFMMLDEPVRWDGGGLRASIQRAAGNTPAHVQVARHAALRRVPVICD